MRPILTWKILGLNTQCEQYSTRLSSVHLRERRTSPPTKFMYLPIKHFLFTARRNVGGGRHLCRPPQVQTDRPRSTCKKICLLLWICDSYLQLLWGCLYRCIAMCRTTRCARAWSTFSAGIECWARLWKSMWAVVLLLILTLMKRKHMHTYIELKLIGSGRW